MEGNVFVRSFSRRIFDNSNLLFVCFGFFRQAVFCQLQIIISQVLLIYQVESQVIGWVEQLEQEVDLFGGNTYLHHVEQLRLQNKNGVKL